MAPLRPGLRHHVPPLSADHPEGPTASTGANDSGSPTKGHVFAEGARRPSDRGPAVPTQPRLTPPSRRVLASGGVPRAVPPLEPLKKAQPRRMLLPGAMRPLQPLTQPRVEPSPPRASPTSVPSPPSLRSPSNSAGCCRQASFERAIMMLNSTYLHEHAAASSGASPPVVTTAGGARFAHPGEVPAAAPTLHPVWLLTDGEVLVVVDINPPDVHRHYAQNLDEWCLPQATSCDTTPRTNPSTSSPAAATEHHLVSWFGLNQLNATTGQEVVELDVAKAWAALPSSSSSAAIRTALTEVHLAQPTLSGPPNTANGGVVLLLQGTSLVHACLHDICHCFLPTFLQAPYPDGVPLRGKWIAPEAAESTIAVTGVAHATSPQRLWTQTPPTAATTPAPGLEALYPALQAVSSRAHAVEVLGRLQVPASVLEEVRSSLPPATSLVSAATTEKKQPWTPVKQAGQPSPREGLTLGGAPVLPAQRRLHPVTEAGTARLSQTTAELSPRRDSQPPSPASATAHYTAALQATGPTLTSLLKVRTNSAKTPALCCSVLVYTQRGKLELERMPATSPPSAASSTGRPDHQRMVTVGDVRQSLVRSALGRSLRLRGGEEQLQLAFAPGLPALDDNVVIDTEHVVLRVMHRRAST